MISWSLLFVCTLLGALGGMFFKLASSDSGLHFLPLGIGLSCYGAAALVNIYVLTLLPYNVVFPLTAITYVWTLFISFLFLKEKISIRQILGVCAILAGAVFIVS